MNRIPALSSVSFDAAARWFDDLANEGLLFHPDDQPEEIVQIPDGSRAFSDQEADHLRHTLNTLFSVLGDSVYEAAYPAFMRSAGFAEPDLHQESLHTGNN